MSQEDVELVRRLYEHWERGDYAGASRLFDPDTLRAGKVVRIVGYWDRAEACRAVGFDGASGT
jgi:ketosteroid isomerase-like protein